MLVVPVTYLFQIKNDVKKFVGSGFGQSDMEKPDYNGFGGHLETG